MEKISKKEIRNVIADLIQNALIKVKLAEPSDRTKKYLVKLSHKLSSVVHDEIKKQAKQKTKALKAVDEDKLLKTNVKVKKKRGDVE